MEMMKKKIKMVFYNYPKMLKDAAISTVDWAESNMAVNYEKLPVQTSGGNFKEMQLCKIIDDNLSKVRWCYMVEKVLDHYHFEDGKSKFIDLFFFKKRNEEKVCLEVGISRATLFRWQDEILETAYNWAKELKLV